MATCLCVHKKIHPDWAAVQCPQIFREDASNINRYWTEAFLIDLILFCLVGEWEIGLARKVRVGSCSVWWDRLCVKH